MPPLRLEALEVRTIASTQNLSSLWLSSGPRSAVSTCCPCTAFGPPVRIPPTPRCKLEGSSCRNSNRGNSAGFPPPPLSQGLPWRPHSPFSFRSPLRPLSFVVKQYTKKLAAHRWAASGTAAPPLRPAGYNRPWGETRSQSKKSRPNRTLCQNPRDQHTARRPQVHDSIVHPNEVLIG